MDVFFQQHKPTSSIAQYLSVGSKDRDTQTLGFELEHFVVEKESLAPVTYLPKADLGTDLAGVLNSDAPSVQKVLESLTGYYSEATYECNFLGSPCICGLHREKVSITLEPGSQLEVSIGPACSVGEIETLYKAFRIELDPILDSLGLKLLELGYHPTALARDIPLLPKPRYEHMDRYFTETGKHGICMMRATASTQVSVDFASERDALRKFRIANALGPLLAFITDNSPIFEGERVGVCGGASAVSQSGYSVPERMARMVCWDDTDPKRCLVAKDAFDDEFSFLRYAENLIEAPGIFLPGNAPDSEPLYLGFTPYIRALPDAFIDEAMVLHILSMFFYDVRFKNYVELRQADSMPLEYALAYSALISGIFYNPEALEYYTECFLYTDSPAIAFAKSALRSGGYEADVYRRPAAEWLDEMIAFAEAGLASEEVHYLAPLAQLVKARTTLLEHSF